MDFRLTEEQEFLRRSVREFAESEIRPHVMHYDEAQEFPRELVRRAAEQGYYGVLFPEELGGAGLGYVEYVIVVEELSRVDGSIGISAAAHNSLCTNHVFACGSDAQRRAYVPKLASGEWIGAWSLTEPTAGSDAGGTKTSAKPAPGGGWVLNGSKTFTTHGSVADLTIVFAVTDPGKGQKGISAFALEKGTPGFRPGKKENKMGLRASDTAEVIMEDCAVPAEAMVGGRGEGFVDAMKILDGGRISIAALALGMARGAYEAALAYSKERHQFGKPISEFQAIQHMLAEMATRLDAASLLVYRAAAMKDAGEKTTLESSMAKLYASEIGVWVADRALQIFGGYGYVKDFPVEKYYRDMKLCTIGEGTSEIQRLVIAREILKAV
ncbi:MAG TPA: acyl-CoA dehydrogenase family protein [Candidatus Polarisedimenticolaceae bacterium]|nr:acyl-CoA dehydrogenase family protein [Candidatus Polarisedimenticolaceae bacterium]